MRDYGERLKESAKDPAANTELQNPSEPNIGAVVMTELNTCWKVSYLLNIMRG